MYHVTFILVSLCNHAAYSGFLASAPSEAKLVFLVIEADTVPKGNYVIICTKPNKVTLIHTSLTY